QLCDLIDEGKSWTFKIGKKREGVFFREAGLELLRRGLKRAGLDARSFSWPPERDPDRAPYRGLCALEAQDAAIFFGRDAAITSALDRIRGLVEVGLVKILVVLGASGAGKSSFVRAGLWPRLQRDDVNFLPLPVVRPQDAVISGGEGLAVALLSEFKRVRAPRGLGHIKGALAKGAKGFAGLLGELCHLQMLIRADKTEANPTIILSLDQAEELFNPDGAAETQVFLEMVAALLAPVDGALATRLLLITTIRSDKYELLQSEP